MPIRYSYLALALFGIIVPYAELIPFLLSHGLDYQVFYDKLFASRISTMFAWGLFISALALFIFVLSEGRQLGMRHLWIPLLGTLLAGVSFGLPIFLYMRQVHLGEEDTEDAS